VQGSALPPSSGWHHLLLLLLLGCQWVSLRCCPWECCNLPHSAAAAAPVAQKVVWLYPAMQAPLHLPLLLLLLLLVDFAYHGPHAPLLLLLLLLLLLVTLQVTWPQLVQ
jgi:hypothetical protein